MGAVVIAGCIDDRNHGRLLRECARKLHEVFSSAACSSIRPVGTFRPDVNPCWDRTYEKITTPSPPTTTAIIHTSRSWIFSRIATGAAAITATCRQRNHGLQSVRVAEIGGPYGWPESLRPAISETTVVCYADRWPFLEIRMQRGGGGKLPTARQEHRGMVRPTPLENLRPDAHTTVMVCVCQPS